MTEETNENQKVITLSKGHRVYLKDEITWKDQKKINATLYSGMKVMIDPVTEKPKDVETDADVYEKQQEQIALAFIDKILDEKGNPLSVTLMTLEKFLVKDYNEIVEATKKLYDDVKKNSPETLAISEE